MVRKNILFFRLQTSQAFLVLLFFFFCTLGSVLGWSKDDMVDGYKVQLQQFDSVVIYL
jgi:hypothetical protein